MTLLAQVWAEVAWHALPAGLSAEERLEARRLFFLGAHALLELQKAAASQDLSPTQRADFERTLRVEMLTFTGTVGTELEGMF